MPSNEDKIREKKDTFIQKLKEDGVVNPQGFALVGFGALFLAAVPLTTWIAQPASLLEKAVTAVTRSIAFLSSAGSTSTLPPTGRIAALSTLYITLTYALSGAASAAASEAGTEGGRDNAHPRAQVGELRGLPLRMHSAHYNLLEMFGGYGLVAALAQAMAPGDGVLVNLLGLHVICKCFVYYPAYVMNFGVARTVAHVLATASVINVGLRLARRGTGIVL
ncbi:hypothetical protein LTR91_006402 [Friedmanniomyces endolithicus]|uniref:Uncharacterized protein n=1 Tax=Friedmanniomyces endolithicus TaxID=329885 RepID=A0A4V5N8H3_9PEZI|nr:hypothetical protein LTS09_010869 [Friedmanniomyces endolithicus]KAK0290212.1 hypothetical protein LTR35_002154 [Friedmanniomyces endolithicus]KAK0299802.1 hypothetical protein LTS00_001572 [Friedmanniomyces endolithicus]KAK0305118.1 hypothetical protein LTR01_006976 [Friedmanniomyces endolithicus]KAK0826216.1 hypothetical protein LTR73_006550 [Friedmanniomyces endolithicus]